MNFILQFQIRLGIEVEFIGKEMISLRKGNEKESESKVLCHLPRSTSLPATVPQIQIFLWMVKYVLRICVMCGV